MLTPVFKITQDEEALFLTVHAPYANVKDTEIEYDGHSVLFYSRPYFLRLHLPRKVTDDDTGTAEFMSDDGKFNIRIPKKIKGEHFPNLDMITELLRPSSRPSAEPSVGEIRNSVEEVDGEDESYELEQVEAKEEVGASQEENSKFGYGFGLHRHGVMEKLASAIGKLVDIDDPDTTLIEERLFKCAKFDEEHFSPDHYLADLFEPNEALEECLSFKIKSVQELTDVDREHLKDIPHRVLPKLDFVEKRRVALALIDLLYAYLYDIRTTSGEHTVESGWTIVKLSPTLCFFVRWNTAKEAVIGSIRRSLCFPLYRNWDLSQTVLQDLRWLLSCGRTAILHCLTDMRTVLSTSGEYRYLLNDLYVTDYCIWVQSVHDNLLEWLREEVNSVEVVKSDVGLDLDDLELEGRLTALKISEGKGSEVDSDDD